MKCIKCGHENENNAKYCDSCGIELSNIENISTNTNNNSGTHWFSGITAILGGIISIIGSYTMTQIKSVSGNSIAETFYSSFGVFGIGFGIFMISIGMYILSQNKK